MNTHCLVRVKADCPSSIVGSIICAAAPTSAILIFGRAWLGLGGAGLLQGALAVIGQTVTVDKVPLFQGIVVSSMAVSVCCGPVIGGALTQYVNWRTCQLVSRMLIMSVAKARSRLVFLDVS